MGVLRFRLHHHITPPRSDVTARHTKSQAEAWLVNVPAATSAAKTIFSFLDLLGWSLRTVLLVIDNQSTGVSRAIAMLAARVLS
jgi:hypothetical protein